MPSNHFAYAEEPLDAIPVAPEMPPYIFDEIEDQTAVIVVSQVNLIPCVRTPPAAKVIVFHLRILNT
jgi:hypothetical protein